MDALDLCHRLTDGHQAGDFGPERWQFAPMLFDHFDRIRIVNLAHRRDRRNEMKRQLARVGLENDPRVSFFPALSCEKAGPFSSRGAHGCFLSHVAVLKEASDAGQSVLVLEDDCDFVFPDVLNYEIPKCDVFYGGYFADDPDDPENSNIIGAHFMGFSARGARIATNYLSDYLSPSFKPDPKAASEPGYDPAIRPGIDGAYVWLRRAHPELLTIFAELGVQRASRTDIGEQNWFDRTPLVRDLVGHLRRIIRPYKRGRSRHVF